jgi:NodT family efflux transporter outer membrane factor (OMF) lipoprotein
MTGSLSLKSTSAITTSGKPANITACSRLLPVLGICLLTVGCAAIGPDFEKPQAPVVEDWTSDNPVISRDSLDLSKWWTVFDDPILNQLIEDAFQQNLSLQLTGLRILEARARLGVAEGNRYPQVQQIGGTASTNRISENGPNFNPAIDNEFASYQFGFDAVWEIDFWGRIGRGVQAADASLNASYADYDDALVSLAAEVARVYVTIRTFETQLDLARQNIQLQTESLRIAQVRFENGATSNLDVQQAKSNLASTQANIPALTSSLYQAMNGLAVLMGKPPGKLKLDSVRNSGIPVAPALVATGIPTELLRRRPDVRSAEFLAASQSALIGVAEGDLYPRFALFGSIGVQTGDTGNSEAADLFDSDSLYYSAGPTFSWNIFNYGQIRNNIRAQDAVYQQTLVNYQDTVLRAYQETEDAMIGFLQAQTEAGFREQSSLAAQRATELANIQYREGATDFQRVIDSERTLVTQQDAWTAARGDIALNLVALYKALGGGWSPPDENTRAQDYISEETRKIMTERTNWGDILDPPPEDQQ